MSENIPAGVPWWSRPIWMGLLGLALMVGGWKLSHWRVLTANEEDWVAAMVAEQMKSDPNSSGVPARQDEIAREVQPYPRYQTLGRLTIFLGVLLFLIAGVRMYREPPPPEQPLSADEPERSVKRHRELDGLSPSTMFQGPKSRGTTLRNGWNNRSHRRFERFPTRSIAHT